MGNKKNQTNKSNSTHRHVFKKKKLPVWLINKNKTHNKQPTKKLEGSRIINMDKLLEYTDELTAHSSSCQGAIKLIGESRKGLASILEGHCETCGHKIVLETSKKVKGPCGYSRWESNLAAVWGQMSTGQGYSQLEESMSTMGIPVMTKASFIATERNIGERWKVELQESMAEAGREEKRLAEENGSYHEGVPAITVIVDGSAHTNTRIMPSQVWPSSLGRQLARFCMLVYATSTAMHVPGGFHRKTMPATRTGLPLLPRWKLTSFWRGLCRLRRCTEFAISDLSGMVTAPCIQLSCRMCLDGGMPFKSSSVLTMHVSATVAHSSNSSRATPPTRAVED